MRCRAVIGFPAGIALLLTAGLSAAPAAQTGGVSRAVLVGIDRYEPPPGAAVPAGAGRAGWTDLDGAVNDAVAVREILTARCGFEARHCTLLTNALAGRAGLLQALQTDLLAASQPDDLAFFFFAGHGSQVRNSLSTEPDGQDETIVPADSCRGAPDIRDKELRAVCNALLDKGVRLVLVFDSCHSGSIGRGLPGYGKSRALPASTRDVADPSPPGQPPEQRGALILSAAQDWDVAKEQRDADGTPHGALSLALVRCLRSAPPGESAERIFLKTKALMQAEGRSQEPVLAASRQRIVEPFFGANAAGANGRILIAALARDAQGLVELQGGLALGLNSGCILRRNGDGPPVRLAVEGTPGLNRCQARVIEGQRATIAAGALFEIEQWSTGGSAGLRVWIPPAAAGAGTVGDVEGVARGLAAQGALRWVADPAEDPPTHVLEFDSGGWTLHQPGGIRAALGRAPTAAALRTALGPPSPAVPRLFVSAPALSALTAQLTNQIGVIQGLVAVAARPEQAHYALVGRMAAGQRWEYAWVRPDMPAASASGAPALPSRTDWVPLAAAPAGAADAARTLTDHATRLGRLWTWFQLENPPGGGTFPYRLGLENSRTGQIVFEGTLREGETYGLVLSAEPASLKRWVPKRFIYVLGIDNSGRTALLFPSGSGNVENSFPLPGRQEPLIRIGDRQLLEVAPPFGVDTYVLLTSAEAVPNPYVLESDGVRARGTAGPGRTPLERLLLGTGARTRGEAGPVPLNWSVDRVSFRSQSGRVTQQPGGGP